MAVINAPIQHYDTREKDILYFDPISAWPDAVALDCVSEHAMLQERKVCLQIGEKCEPSITQLATSSFGGQINLITQTAMGRLILYFF